MWQRSLAILALWYNTMLENLSSTSFYINIVLNKYIKIKMAYIIKPCESFAVSQDSAIFLQEDTRT